MQRLKGMAVVFLLRILAFLPLTTARLVGRGFGEVLYRCRSRACAVAQVNLALCYPNADPQWRDRVCRARMTHLAQTAFETPGLWRRSMPWLHAHIVDIVGKNCFEASLEQDSGTIFLIPHQGNWEVAGLWIAQYTRMTSLYEPPKLAALETLVKTARERSGASLVPTNARGVAALLKAIKAGQSTGILPDQQPPESGGIFSPFFGVPALSMTLVHRLLQRCDARVVLCAALRKPGGWSLHFTEADGAIYSTDQAASLEALNRGVEQIVNLEPEQYLWEYKRFRKQPIGSPSVYDNLNNR